MNAREARLTARAAQLDTKKLCPSPCPHHDSAASRPHQLICTGAEPIHPVHCPRQLPAWPRKEVIVLPFWRGFKQENRNIVSANFATHSVNGYICNECNKDVI